MKRLLCRIRSAACLVLVLTCSVLTGGCAGPPEVSVDDGRLQVVTTVFPQYDFVRQIAGEHVQLSMLLKPGADSHSYEPAPQDIIKVRNADVFIYVGGENDTWIEDMLSSMDLSHMRTVRLVDCVETMTEEEEHEEHGGHEEEVDEHVWTAPANAAAITQHIARVLEDADPDNRDVYADNCRAYVEQLNQLDRDFREVIGHGNRKTIVFGDRFPLRYFAEAYGLTSYSALPGCASDTEASAATVAFLADKVREEQIPVVFKLELTSDSMARTIAGESGAKVLTFHSCHNVTREQLEGGATYVSLMRENMEHLREALE